ncbi:type II toxin-antitoxin system VapC family toxin, partial [Escherichia coli]|uniref:type II toxin-antitoxin system VapC family toxin n=1 Tax=Escherichia coli TaxID=562 RepID=UPI0028E03280
WWTDDPLLSATARAFIQNQDNTVLVSTASAWDIATKYRLGKLESAAEAVSRFHERVTLDAFEHLPVTSLHALRAGTLEADHRDPFDRML